MSASHKTFWGIFIGAFLLRVTGINFGLPQIMHQDEPIVVNHALAYASFDLNPHFFKIPPLLSYLVFAVYGAVYVVLHFLRGISVNDFALWFFRDPTFFYVLARFLFGVILGTASVYVLYRLAKKLFGEPAAFWAALFFAVNYLHVRDSHYVYADIPMLFSILMVCRYLVNYLERDLTRDLLWASVWVGIATAFKYIAAPIMAPVFLAAYLAKKKKCFPWVFSLSALAVLIFFCLNFSIFYDVGFFMQEIFEQARAETSSGLLHHALYSLAGVDSSLKQPWLLVVFEVFGWLGVFTGFLGILMHLVKFPAKFWVWVFPASYYIFIAHFSQAYERYAMPLVPFLCLGIGYLLSSIWRRYRMAAIILGVLLLAQPLAKSVYLDTLILKPDTRTEARRWIEVQIPENSVIAIDHAFFSPNLVQTSKQMRDNEERVNSEDLHRDFKIKRFELLDKAQKDKKRYSVCYVDPYHAGSPKFLSWSHVIPADASAFEKEGVQYLIHYHQPADDKRPPGEFAYPVYFDDDPELKKHMRRVVKIFSPYYRDDKKSTVDTFANVALPFLSAELFSRKAPGPYLEVYEWVNGS